MQVQSECILPVANTHAGYTQLLPSRFFQQGCVRMQTKLCRLPQCRCMREREGMRQPRVTHNHEPMLSLPAGRKITRAWFWGILS